MWGAMDMRREVVNLGCGLRREGVRVGMKYYNKTATL